MDNSSNSMMEFAPTSLWPEIIMRSFSISSATPEKPFYGPWNRLLNTMFPPDTSFEIVPQYLPPFMNSRDAADFVLLLLVYVESSPVLIVEVKPPVEFSRPSKRQEADIQMCLRFLDAAAELQIPMLYGISAFGTKITFYKYNKSTNSLIHPQSRGFDRYCSSGLVALGYPGRRGCDQVPENRRGSERNVFRIFARRLRVGKSALCSSIGLAKA
ncbi:hypothetical protein HWV62_16616 [Athelia sp. TMB]|nr:hypothetical protein HWV62_16616 [Athelia sp. TMB]